MAEKRQRFEPVLTEQEERFLEDQYWTEKARDEAEYFENLEKEHESDPA